MEANTIEVTKSNVALVSKKVWSPYNARKGIQEKYQEALYTAMGLAATALGINTIVSNMPNSQYPVLFFISLAAGSWQLKSRR